MPKNGEEGGWPWPQSSWVSVKGGSGKRQCKTGCNSSNTDTYPTDLVEKEDVPEYLVEVVQALQVLQVLADVEDVEQFLHRSSPSSIMHSSPVSAMFQIRIGSGFNWISGSKLGIRI